MNTRKQVETNCDMNAASLLKLGMKRPGNWELLHVYIDIVFAPLYSMSAGLSQKKASSIGNL